MLYIISKIIDTKINTIYIMSNILYLLEFYKKPDGATKKKIFGCIYLEKLVFENEKAPYFCEASPNPEG